MSNFWGFYYWFMFEEHFNVAVDWLYILLGILVKSNVFYELIICTCNFKKMYEYKRQYSPLKCGEDNSDVEQCTIWKYFNKVTQQCT